MFIPNGHLPPRISFKKGQCMPEQFKIIPKYVDSGSRWYRICCRYGPLAKTQILIDTVYFPVILPSDKKS